jgi:hypothetical protein
MKRRLIFIITGLCLYLSVFANGQSVKKTVDGAWIYLGTWESYQQEDSVKLVKSWNTPITCLISFENGLYTTWDESSNERESGKWEVVRLKGNKRNKFLIIIIDNKRVEEFEILSASSTSLNLRRKQ